MPVQPDYERILLLRTSRALNSTADLDQVLLTVLDEVRRALDVTACSIWLVECGAGGTTELVCRQASGPAAECVRGQRLQPGEGIAGWVVQTGESVVLADAQTDERHCKAVDQRTGLRLHSMLSVPLQVKDSVIGVLQVLDQTVGRFDERDQALLASLAVSAATVIDNARLVEKLNARTAELEARNEELDAFAQTVAHDLKNPLSLIIGFAEATLMDYEQLSEQEIRDSLERVLGSGRKMQQIIDGILKLSRVQQTEELEIRPLDMAEILGEAHARLGPLLEANGAEFLAAEEWPVVLGYGPWLEEVWINFISNAIKYGGRPPRVQVGFDVNGAAGESGEVQVPAQYGAAQGASDVGLRAIRFWVRDNGPGLSPEEQEQLFKPFTRLNGGDGRGHGLGLSIVRRMVEKLRGQVSVESEVGRGSTFAFTLPGLARGRNAG